jgi:hypothetical protein
VLLLKPPLLLMLVRVCDGERFELGLCEFCMCVEVEAELGVGLLGTCEECDPGEPAAFPVEFDPDAA